MIALVLGWGAWIAAAWLVPAPLIDRLLLAGPLIVVPQVLAALPARAVAGGPTTRSLPALVTVAAAVPLLGSFALPAGAWAAILALPWLTLAAACAAGRLRHALKRRPRLLRPPQAADLGADAAIGFLFVGALFVAAYRLGLHVLDFEPLILSLTAVHFHFAGFGLLGLVALNVGQMPRLGRVAVAALVAGMPLTALGFTVGSLVVGWLGSLVVVTGGIGGALLIGTAGLRERGSRRLLLVAAAAALLAGLPLGIGWATASMLGFRFLDLDTMVRTHGALNASGVVLASVALARERAGS